MIYDHEEKICICALNRLFGFEPKTAHGLIGMTGSAGAVFNLSHEEKMELLGPFSKISPLLNDDELRVTEEELRRLYRNGCSFITMTDPGYPELLKECEDAPLGLYYRGCDQPEKVFGSRPGVAVVGTRDISLYGKEWCRKIVGAMATARIKPAVISGLAFGTDITAHLAALEYGLPTIAVLPTCVDAPYPSRHRGYAGTISSTPGCALISDYPPGTEAKPINFIRRNRIIAGVSCGTILVESKSKGGGMITARLAASYGRDVMVLPGRADDMRSKGCNILLREKLAEPVTDTVNFLDTLGLGSTSRKKKECLEEEITALYGQILPEDEMAEILAVVTLVQRERGITLDGISSELCMPYGTVARYTGMLESDGIIRTDLLQRCVINHKNA